MSLQTRAGLLAEIRRKLIEADIPDAANEARELLLHVLQLDRVALLTAPEACVSEADSVHIQALTGRRIAGEPVDRLLGQREFYGRIFHLNEATLAPREDSEALVEMVLELVDTDSFNGSMLDLGTGTGCLLLSLVAELPLARGTGIDISDRAVEMARENANRLGLSDRAQFKQGDWLAGLEDTYDLILSNPPYIARSALATLEKEVRDHDPHLALDGGEDGLVCYRQIAKAVRPRLEPGGYVLVEIGQGQAPEVTDIFARRAMAFKGSKADAGGICRVLVFQSIA